MNPVTQPQRRRKVIHVLLYAGVKTNFMVTPSGIYVLIKQWASC